MKIKNILMATLLVVGANSANAQQKTEYVFQPHWYVSAQGGAQYTLGEVSFGDLISPNVQASVGYNFNPIVGLRLGVNAWQSKAGLKGTYSLEEIPFEYNWKQKYVAPNLDVVVNLSNLIAGFNPERLVSVGIFAGIGANIGFDNGAGAVSAEISSLYPKWVGPNGQNIAHVWNGTKCRVQGRAGANVDFRLSGRVSLGVEVNANILSDHYNSKHAPNADWYFNALAGVKVNLGKTYTKKVVEVVPETKTVERVVEKVVEKIVEKPAVIDTANIVMPLRRDIFFTISSTGLTIAEKARVEEIVEYMTKYPQTKVSITGYADKGTGRAAGNLKLSEKRAAIVAEYLKSKGIAADRITTSFKGDTEQPYDINDLNRVSICIAK